MLVCAYNVQFGTRDRGCSRHPAFPAPSGLRGPTNLKSSGETRREIVQSHLMFENRIGSLLPSPLVGEGKRRGVLDTPALMYSPSDDSRSRLAQDATAKSAVGIGTPCPLLVLDVRGNRCSA